MTIFVLAVGHGANARNSTECGFVSWYGRESGRTTANGERFLPNGVTAAHRTLPFGTKLMVTFGKRAVFVRVNDRGPASHTGRALDLSLGAARQLGMIQAGVVHGCWREF